MAKKKANASYTRTPRGTLKKAVEPNYKVKCICCEGEPTVGNSRMCGPCYFGDASTAGGNW